MGRGVLRRAAVTDRVNFSEWPLLAKLSKLGAGPARWLGRRQRVIKAVAGRDGASAGTPESLVVDRGDPAAREAVREVAAQR